MDCEEFEYRNGVRLFQLEHEKSQFERMLDRYTAKAKHHFNVKMSKTLTQDERDVKLREALKELEHERRHLETMAIIQAELDTYREAGLRVKSGTAIDRKSALNMMAAEKHHGTETLEKYMRAEGVPKPSSKHTAHHIVPGSGKLKVLMNQIRVHLHLNGIRINDPANGVYLLHRDEYTPHWSMPASRGHLKYHTHDYERWVASRIRPLKNIDAIKTNLQIIGRMLQSHEPKSLPKK